MVFPNCVVIAQFATYVRAAVKFSVRRAPKSRRRFCSSSQPTSRNVWLCKPGHEQFLRKDILLQCNTAEDSSLAVYTGRVESPSHIRTAHYPAWCQQYLPNTKMIHGNSIMELAMNVIDQYLICHPLVTPQNCGSAAWHIHAFESENTQLHRRAQLIKQALVDTLSNKRGKIGRLLSHALCNMRNGGSQMTAAQPGHQVLQLLLLSATELYASYATFSFNETFGWNFPLPWERGIIPIKTDKQPPSRAYRKLAECFHLVTSPLPNAAPFLQAGARVVELGSAPGGWTMGLLDRGFVVTSIDRAPLEKVVFLHPRAAENLKHIIADGTSWFPNGPVDGVFCDMAVPAATSAQVLMKWVERGIASRIVWTLKFVGHSDYGLIHTVRMKLQEANSTLAGFTVRHYPSHGNEVVVIGTSRNAIRSS